MDNLEPYPGFYDQNGYGEYERQFLHHATVSMLNIYIYKDKVVKLRKFYPLLIYRIKKNIVFYCVYYK